MFRESPPPEAAGAKKSPTFQQGGHRRDPQLLESHHYTARWHFNSAPLSLLVVHEQKETVERVMGIEPTLAAWEAAVLPLNYTRMRVDSRA